jgi:hypothetical protein
MMSNSPGGFDLVGVVVDWIDACRERKLPALLDLYDDSAIVDCCEGGRFRGRTEVEQYWQPKLFGSVPGAFEIDVLMPEVEGVLLEYRSYDGRAVRTRFRFTAAGKILRRPAPQYKTTAPVQLAA